MKKFIYMVMLVLYLLGMINGIGYCIYLKEWPTLIGVVVLAVMAFPTAKKYFEYLFVKDN